MSKPREYRILLEPDRTYPYQIYRRKRWPWPRWSFETATLSEEAAKRYVRLAGSIVWEGVVTLERLRELGGEPVDQGKGPQ